MKVNWRALWCALSHDRQGYQDAVQGRAGSTVRTPDTLKSLRESLCIGQTAILAAHPEASDLRHTMVLQRLIDDIDRQRPLDRDGRHRRHTAACGCEDR